jgi:hypothetical protein
MSAAKGALLRESPFCHARPGADFRQLLPKQISSRGVSGLVPKGRLRVAQHAVLVYISHPEQSRRDG